MIIYKVERRTTMDGHRVNVHLIRNGIDITHQALSSSLHVDNHSPTGFEFGYSGSGPTQLALAILLDCTGQPELAAINSFRFRERFITPQRGNAFEINERDILHWIGEQIGATI